MPRLEWSFLMPAEDHHQVKWLMAYFHYRLTPWGVIILPAVGIGLAVSSVGTQIAGYLLPSYILALLITAYGISLFFRPRVRAYRVLPPAPSAGAGCLYSVVVENTGKRPIRNLTVYEQCLPYGIYPNAGHPQWNNSIDWLDPGERVTLTLAIRTPRRGTFELPLLVAGSSFPSGFMRSIRRVGKREKFTVFPKLLPPIEPPGETHRQLQPGGISLSSRVGDSNEFASTREYRQGDRLRDVHWVSSAKTGKLIVKEYIEEYFVRVGLFLDTELGTWERHKCFESRVSLCAGTADRLNKDDCIIDLFLSDKHHPHLQIGRSVEHFHRLLEALSVIEGDTRVDFSESAARIKEHAPQLSRLVCFLKDWDAPRARFIRQLQDLGLNLQVIIVREKPTTVKIDDETVTVVRPAELKAPR